LIFVATKLSPPTPTAGNDDMATPLATALKFDEMFERAVGLMPGLQGAGFTNAKTATEQGLNRTADHIVNQRTRNEVLLTLDTDWLLLSPTGTCGRVVVTEIDGSGLAHQWVPIIQDLLQSADVSAFPNESGIKQGGKHGNNGCGTKETMRCVGSKMVLFIEILQKYVSTTFG